MARDPSSLPRHRAISLSRVLFLAATPSAHVGAPVELDESEVHHALRVLRLRVGDVVDARDGRGSLCRVRIARADRHTLAAELAEPPHHEPPPGADGAPLPHIEIATAWPRDARGEDMLARLVQLGAASVVPLETEHTGEQRRATRRERLERILVENLKQCGRAWLPHLGEPRTLAAHLAQAPAAPSHLLDPRAPTTLAAALAALAAESSPERVHLYIGPEGGWSAAERHLLDQAGVRAARLGPHVLRIETAAEAACALAACLLERR
jgi:16S rRNA (uracil1498-N3)-methyltransferase